MSICQTRNSLIEGYINNTIIEEQDVQESKIRLIAKNSLKFIGILSAGMSKIPFVPINLQLQEMGDFRFVLAGGNTLGFWALESWSITHIVDDIFGSANEKENLLTKDQIKSIHKIISIFSAIVLSVASQAVIAYLAYEYNDKNIIMPVMMFPALYFPFYSTYLSVNKIFQIKSFSSFEKKLDSLRQKLIASIKNNHNYFIEKSKEKKIDYVNRFHVIKKQEDRLNYFLLDILKENRNIEAETQQAIGMKIASLIGAFLTINQLALLGIIAYVGGIQSTSSQIGGIVALLVTISSNLYLTGLSHIRTVKRIFKGIYDFTFCQHKASLPEQLSPKFNLSLKLIGVVISLLAWGPTVQIAGDYIDNYSYKLYNQIVVSIGVTIMILMANLDILDTFVNMKILARGSMHEKDVMKVNDNFIKFMEIINKSSILEIAKFIKCLPADILDSLLNDHKISKKELDEYILSRSLKKQESAPLLINP